MTSITIRGLTKRFGPATILDSIDLDIAAGELFFLLGPSGCGKTTLLRHIAGFYQPDAGRVMFGSEDVTNTPAHKRGTGMMFQSYALWPHLTVAQNVAFGLEEQGRPRAEITQRVDAALALVKLGGLGSRRIAQLSGGQQQRVALARALVIRPRCLLLDEPLSNLDTMLRLEMRAEIRGICKQFGITAVYVTHDQEEALAMADKIAVMDKGKVQQHTSPVEIYRQPANRMVAEFIGETNFISGTLQERDSNQIEQINVETPVGVLIAQLHAIDWIPKKGQPVTVSIRPEALMLIDENDRQPPVGRNRFSGRIVSATYLGSSAQYQVVVNDFTSLKLTQMNPQRLLDPSSEPVEMFAKPEDLVVLPG